MTEGWGGGGGLKEKPGIWRPRVMGDDGNLLLVYYFQFA